MYDEIVTATPNILLAYATLGLIAIAPGPTAMAIMGISMSQGRRAGFRFTAGCMSGAATWATLAGFGLSAWLTNYAEGIIILKVAGGLYLFWMAIKALRSALTPEKKNVENMKHINGTKLYRRGLLLHLTNPKAILGWASVMAISQTGTGSIPVLLVTLVGCLLLTNIIHFTYAHIFASKVAMTAYRRLRRWIEGTLSVVFGYAGFRLIAS